MNSPLVSNRLRGSFWRSSFISLALIIALVILVYILDSIFGHRLSLTGLVFAGLIIAFAPAAIWLSFFYRLDHFEPEPKEKVVQVFILGGLVAAAIGIPLVENIFKVQDWIYTEPWITLLGSILVIGIAQETLIYAAVRFSIFPSSEFDEVTDGIVYATAAGLGFATALNITFIINSNGADLGLSAIRVSLNSLAHAGFAGLMGYFLGCDKFLKKPVWWQAAGVALASVLNGIFFFLYGNLSKPRISASPDPFSPWLGFVLAVFLSVAVTITLGFLVRRVQFEKGGDQ